MDTRGRHYKKEADARAREYLAAKRGYITKEEKKAFAIASRLRRECWLDSRDGLEADEKRSRLRAYRRFRLKVFFGGLFIGKRRGARRSAPEGGHIFNGR